MERAHSLQQLSNALNVVSRAGQWITGALSVVGLVALFGFVFVAIDSKIKQDGVETVSALMFIMSVFCLFFASTQLNKIAGLLKTGEFLTDSMATLWWRLSHAVVLGGVLKLFTPREMPKCDPADITTYDFVPPAEGIYYFVVLVVCCYVVALILREAARVKQEALEAKKENEGFI